MEDERIKCMEDDAGDQCLTEASVRESNVNALKASLLTYPTLFAFSSPSPDDNGTLEQSFFPAGPERVHSCATAHDSHMVPF